jgi:hypothetical protein
MSPLELFQPKFSLLRMTSRLLKATSIGLSLTSNHLRRSQFNRTIRLSYCELLAYKKKKKKKERCLVVRYSGIRRFHLHFILPTYATSSIPNSPASVFTYVCLRLFRIHLFWLFLSQKTWCRLLPFPFLSLSI